MASKKSEMGKSGANLEKTTRPGAIPIRVLHAKLTKVRVQASNRKATLAARLAPIKQELTSMEEALRSEELAFETARRDRFAEILGANPDLVDIVAPDHNGVGCTDAETGVGGVLCKRCALLDGGWFCSSEPLEFTFSITNQPA